ncbi:N-(5'-phosphoribosyl)anthranilate isomerase [Anaerocolumna cellulosilytica]|uniref:N-(5'-phosphoribosyl)anthranilate isomerase n=1 Tax=Anaerocolumna cellulosilytica TaxID=433286 RepID=A0A6S6R5D8_9FIRM|nr:phosphoribosylanthranilate isomerase [Anaerocolumna cellulosilytica]MBB5194158.1 phosphoribosylanthranilate isomerase [Anaerocolumna cellulosilytica]BCJ94630.1 N-(5'-phosphoribosyl)anthranilate isomerase [Anaerocolumna cellulosilytica]
MTKIKICGLKTLKDIQAVNKYMPDYIGFVFAESKRKIDLATARLLRKNLSSDIRSVGVFVNAPIAFIQELYKENIIDMIQLHGDEDLTYIHELNETLNAPVIKAIRVQSQKQLLSVKNFPSAYLLLDTYHKNQYGGSGISFNRSLIPKDYRAFFLAGGLNAENIKEAISDCRPYCIDISSGVETEGAKDEEKIREVIKIVKGL